MWLMVLVACGWAAPSTRDPTPAASARCDDVPVLTWENFGQGFLLEELPALPRRERTLP